jgi:pilus assembly protein CpaC
LQEKTDLLITVTPHLVKPVQEGEINYPGENMQEPNWFEFYLEGRFEGRRSPHDRPAISRHSYTSPANSSGKEGGLEGEFGHQ